MQVMSIGQQPFLKKLIENETFMDTKVVHPLELHYHSTFKEILAIKHGIESTTIVPPPLCVYPIIDPSSSSSSSSATSDDILNMIKKPSPRDKRLNKDLNP